MYLAARADAPPVSSREIAAAYDISHQFLVQILLQLKTARIVTSTRGVSGGYRLTRPAEAITLGEIIEVIEGTDNEARGRTTADTPGRRVLNEVWTELGRLERNLLDQMRLSDLVARAQQDSDPMYFI